MYGHYILNGTSALDSILYSCPSNESCSEISETFLLEMLPNQNERKERNFL